MAASASASTPRQPPVTKQEIFGWCMYDAADSAFTTVIITAFYAPFFSKVIVGDPIQGAVLWGNAASISEAAVAVLAPILGAIADFSGSRKKFLGACALTIIAFTGALWFVKPGMVGLAMTLFIIANIGFAGGGIFIDSFLPGLSNDSNAGRISGIKWAIGYVSGLASVVIAGMFAGAIDTPTPELISQTRLVPVIVAAYYAVMVIPTFLFLRDRSIAQTLPPGENYISIAFKQLRRTFQHVRRYRELVKLLIAFLIYNDGVVTVIFFAAIFAVDTIGFTSGDLIFLFVTTNIVAAAGAFSFGRLADWIGQKRTIMISLVVWIAAVTVCYFAYSRTAFWVGAALVGIGMGSTQSVTRSLLALFTPQQNASEFFGFLGIAGKALAFLGPILFGRITAATGSQRPAILAIAGFFIIGMIMLMFVDEAKGKAAARVPI